MARLIDADEFERRIKKYDTTYYADKALYNFAHNEMITMPTVCDIEQIRAEIEALPRELPTDARNMVRRTRVLDIIDRYTKGADK